MMEHTIPQEYGEIYLQVNLEEWDSIEYEWNGVTWCSDLIYDDDVKYLLATPEREAAPKLLEALDYFLQDYHNGKSLEDAALKASVAIIQAEKPEEEKE